jgi:hypothetical protein
MTFSVKSDGKGTAFFQASGRIFRNSLKAANRKAAGIIRDGIEKVGLATFQRNSPRGLARSFRVVDVSDQGASVRSDKVYAGIQDRGGVILAKRAPYLHFQTYDGHWVKTKKSVIKATHFIRRGVESKRRELENFTQNHLRVTQTKAAVAAGRSRDIGGRFT